MTNLIRQKYLTVALEMKRGFSTGRLYSSRRCLHHPSSEIVIQGNEEVGRWRLFKVSELTDR